MEPTLTVILASDYTQGTIGFRILRIRNVLGSVATSYFFHVRCRKLPREGFLRAAGDPLPGPNLSPMRCGPGRLLPIVLTASPIPGPPKALEGILLRVFAPRNRGIRGQLGAFRDIGTAATSFSAVLAPIGLERAKTLVAWFLTKGRFAPVAMAAYRPATDRAAAPGIPGVGFLLAQAAWTLRSL